MNEISEAEAVRNEMRALYAQAAREIGMLWELWQLMLPTLSTERQR